MISLIIFYCAMRWQFKMSHRKASALTLGIAFVSLSIAAWVVFWPY